MTTLTERAGMHAAGVCRNRNYVRRNVPQAHTLLRTKSESTRCETKNRACSHRGVPACEALFVRQTSLPGQVANPFEISVFLLHSSHSANFVFQGAEYPKRRMRPQLSDLAKRHALVAFRGASAARAGSKRSPRVMCHTPELRTAHRGCSMGTTGV